MKRLINNVNSLSIPKSNSDFIHIMAGVDIFSSYTFLLLFLSRWILEINV